MSDLGLLPKEIERCLPCGVVMALAKLSTGKRICADEINEIRLRAHGSVSVTYGTENIILECDVTEGQIGDCVTKLCRGSVYAHGDTIRRGYIIADGGVRVGVCGRLAADGRALSEITSVNIRVPHIVRGVCEGLFAHFAERGVRSTLIYSPPGVGKTTLLRDLAARLGKERRVAVVDTRGELYIEKMLAHTMCDVLVGYSRAEGIEIATRTLSPEVIICDEIGDEGEVRQMLSATNSGVPIIASAHASGVRELMTRVNLRLLHDGGVFSDYVGICRERINGRLTRSFIFDITPWEDVP